MKSTLFVLATFAVISGCGNNKESAKNKSGNSNSENGVIDAEVNSILIPGVLTTPDSTQPGDPNSSGEPSGSDPLAESCSPNPIEGRLRRLTPVQYLNTLSDLNGSEFVTTAYFQPDATVGSFSTPADNLKVNTVLATQYELAAQEYAVSATANLTKLLSMCTNINPPSDACVESFISSFGLSVFRQPVLAEQKTKLMSIYKTARAQQLSVNESLGFIIEALLQSPYFIYRFELGLETLADGKKSLNSYELATAISYTIIESMPDSILMAKASDGSIKNDAVLKAEVERLLSSTKASRSTTNFITEFLGLDKLDSLAKNAASFPNFTPSLATSMKTETITFFNHVVHTAENNTYKELMTAPYSFLNSQLATFYGTSSVGSEFKKVGLNSTQRSGLLTQGTFLAINATASATSPIHRGITVRENFLCGEVPELPPNVDTSVITIPPGSGPMTTRDAFIQHSKDPACSSCHQLFDPIGFAFESFDGLGAFRTMENGLPVDTSSSIIGTKSTDGNFADAIGLVKHLADSQEAQSCFANQWYRYSQGYTKFTEDQCVQKTFATNFVANGGNIKTMLMSAILDPLFQLRK